MVRDEYRPLPEIPLESEGVYYLPDAQMPPRVRLDSPAIEVMTDLHRIPAATIMADVSLDEAHQIMILRGVRMLLVTDFQRRVTGLITAVDILGEKPLQAIRERGIKRSELLVRDVMTPYDKLNVIKMADVLTADVGNVVATLKRAGRQHALVVGEDTQGRHTIRGIFSASQIARQMGIPIHTPEVARTFAEIEAAIAS